MAKLKRLACAVVSAALTASMLTGCNSGRYCMSYGNKDVNSGVYIYNIVSELLSQQYMMYLTGEDTSEIMDKKVDGKDMASYLEDNAMKNTKEYCAITDQFDKLGLSLTDEENKTISSSANDTYNSQKDMLEELGISKESVKMVLKQSKMKDKIFNYLYDKDGKEEVPDADLEKYVSENYLRYKTISISKSTNKDDAEKEKENKEIEERIDKYFKQAEGLSFEDFDKVIETYDKDEEAKNKQDTTTTTSDDSSKVGEPDTTTTTASPETPAATSSSSAADSSSSSSSSSESSSSSDSSSKADSLSSSDSSSSDDHDHDHDHDLTSDSSSKADDSSAADNTSSSTDTTGETDKYKNETMVNYSTISESTLKEDYGKMMTEIKNMSTGKAVKYSNDSAYYIIIKGDTSERSKDYTSSNRASLLKEMKEKEFDKKIEGWEEDLNIKVDNSSIKRYSAKSLYNKYTDYLSKKKS